MTKWVSSEVQKAGNAGQKVVNTVGDVGQKTVNTVGQVGQAIINNPMPVIETVALTAALGPSGLALGLPAAATAATAAAAVTAANGGDVKQIATAAATAGAGVEATQLVAPYTGPAISGAAPGSVSPVASAAGGAVGGAVKGALTGQDIGKEAGIGAAVSGLAAAGAQGASKAYGAMTTPTPQYVTNYADPSGPPIQTNVQGNYNIAPQGNPYAPGGLGLSGQPTSGLDASTIGQSTTSETPGLKYSPLSNPVFTPGGVNYSLASSGSGEGIQGQPSDALTTSPQTLSPAAQSALQSVLGAGLSAALNPPSSKGGGVGGSSVPTSATDLATTGTTSSPTSGPAPGGEVGDISTGGAKKNVWNLESLREGLGIS